MPNNDHQRARRCIAKTQRGSQCKNSIDCPHHRCEELDCEEEALHTRRGIPVTPMNLRQEHFLPRKRKSGIARVVFPRSISDPIPKQSTRTKTVISKRASSNNTFGNGNRSMQATRPETIPMPYTAHPESRFDRSRGVSDPKLTHLGQRQRLNTIKSMVESIENIRNGAVDTPKKVDSKNEKAKTSNQNKTQHQNARPADSLEVSENNKTDNYDQDDQEKASGLGHVWESEKTRPRSAVLKAAVSSPPICQPGLIEHESLDIGSRRPIVQPVLSRSEDKRIRQEPDDATVPEPASQYQNSLASNVDLRTFANFRISPLLDSFNSKFDIGQEVSWTDEGKIYPKFPANPLADRAMAYPTLSSTLPDPDLEAGVTAQDKEKERRYSNGRDHTERPASTSVALEAENAETRDIDAEMAATSAMSERREAENTERRERGEIDDRLAQFDRVEAENRERKERAEIDDGLARFDKLTAENTETRDRDAEPETRNITRRQSLPSLQSLQTHTPPSTLNLNRVSMTVSTTSHGIDISQMRELEPQMMEMARWDNSRLLRRVSM